MKEWFDKFLGEKFRESLLRKEGVVAPVDRRYDTKTKEFTLDQRSTNYCVYFVLPFDEELAVALETGGRSVPYDGVYQVTVQKLKCSDIVEITFKDIAELIGTLSQDEARKFARWASEETRLAFERERQAKIAENKAKLANAKIHSLTRDVTRADYLHLLYAMGYDEEDNRYCWDKYNTDYVASDFPGTPDMVSNNRAFYCLDDGNYFVVSKNNYDTFWASQGNGFESCFSLTSDYRYIRGVPFWIAHNGFYMCYITDGDVTKWSAFPGHKCKLPRMKCRAWGYRRPNGTLALGKTYGKTDGCTMNKSWMWNASEVTSIFGDTRPDGFTIRTDFEMGKYSVYYDNLRHDNYVSDDGAHGCGASGGNHSFASVYKNIEFNDKIEFFGEATVCGGRFVKLEILPFTRLIKNPLNQHIEALFTEPTEVDVQCNMNVGNTKSRASYYSKNFVGTDKTVCVYVTFNESGITIRKEGESHERFIATL